MRSWKVEESFGVEKLRLVEGDDPIPGPGEVRVRPTAWSLNYRDWLVVTGRYDPKIALPFVPLSDTAGCVDAVGDGVDPALVGRRVAATFAPGWLAGPPDKAALRSALGGGGAGMASDAVVLPRQAWVEVPEHLSDEEAATLPCAALTAWVALYEQSHLRPGQSVLVQGTGGVSIFALQLARLAGARVIVTSSRDDKLERARGLGASETINYVEDESWGRTARALSGGAGVDHVIEVGGAGTMEQSLSAVRPGGTISVIGILRGAAPKLALTRVLMNVVRLQGIMVGPRDAFERMCRAVDEARLRPVVDRVFAFEELPDALAHLESGQHFGKVALSVSAPL